MHVLVLGAGQLARMMSLAGAPLNIQISAFDVTSGDIVHPLTQTKIGHGLENAIKQADVITAEFEHIPHNILDTCQASGKLLPDSKAIKIGGDRKLEKYLLDQANVENAPYHFINQKEDFEEAINTVGIPMVLKSTLGGYDGKGQWRLTDTANKENIWQEIQDCLNESEQQAIIAEAFIAFDREVSIVGVRGKQGEIATYPLAENIHTNGILSISTAVENPDIQLQAERMFKKVATALDYVGVLAIEFFDVQGKLLVNEIAPRVHNSGHWTQQGAEICQFENHLRAVCGLPIGGTQLIRPTTMLNIIGKDTLPLAILKEEACHVHWYGKENRAGRKMGHINISAHNHQDLSEQLLTISEILDNASFPALKKFALRLEGHLE